MIFEIEIDEKTDKGKNLFDFLNEQQIKYFPKILSAKDVDFGIGRKATDEELAAYLLRCMESETLDIEQLIHDTKS